MSKDESPYVNQEKENDVTEENKEVVNEIEEVQVDQPSWKDLATNPVDWDEQLLIAAVNGTELVDPEDGIAKTYQGQMGRAALVEVVKVLRQRVDIDPAWDVNDIVTFYSKDIEPEKTASGVWLRDVTRSKRPAKDWTDAELLAWNAGEISAEGVVTPNGLKAELQNRKLIKPTIKASIHSPLKRSLTSKEEEARTVVKPILTPSIQEKLTKHNLAFVVGVLDRYVDATNPSKRMNTEQGATAQRELDQLFKYVFRLEGQALLGALEIVKTYIRANRKSVFSPDNAYRFIDQVNGDAVYQSRHVNFIEMFMIVEDADKAMRKQMDYRKLFKGYVPDNRIEAILEYFKDLA